MKTYNYLSAGLLAGLIGASMPAYAVNAETKFVPNLYPDEQGLKCLAESVVSAVGAVIEQFGCRKATYPLEAEIDQTTGAGTMTISTRSFVMPDVVNGRCFVSTPGDGKIGTVSITDFSGLLFPDNASQGWSSNSAIMISAAKLRVAGIPTFYDEHNIKNFWKFEKDGFDVRDHGLEVITKNGRPMSKWEQWSFNRPPDGVPGRLWFKKDRIFPGRFCRILLDASGDHGGGATTWTGTVTVSSTP